jgi:uroporphyrinogen decarboxylase
MPKADLIQALHGEQITQTPWLPHIGTHAAQLLGVSAEVYLQDAALLAQGALLCTDRYQCDGIPLVDDPQLEAMSLGCLPHWSAEGPPSLISAPLAGIPVEHIAEYLPPLPNETMGRWPTVISAGTLMKSELEKRDVALVGIAAGPCTIAYQLRGLALFTDLLHYPDHAAQLFSYAGQVSARSAHIYANVIGCDIVAVNDTPATMLKSEYFQRYVIPNLQTAWQIIHSAGRTSSFWA